MDFTKIPYSPLDEDRKLVLETIMTVGNEVLHNAHAIAKQNLGEGKYPRSSFRRELFKKIDENRDLRKVHLYGAVLSTDDVSAIQCVRDVEWDIMCGYSRLVEKHANKWNKKQGGIKNVEFIDLYQEGIMALQAAIYGYKDLGIFEKSKRTKFITYAQHAIHRKMIVVMNKANPLSAFTTQAKELLGEFNQVKSRINAPVTFDEIAELMKLNNSQIQSLQAMFRKVVTSSVVTQDNEESDYSSLVRAEKPEVPDQLDEIQQKAIILANLDEWEKKVLKAFLTAPTNSTGWKTEVAASNVNPATGKPYSRMAPLLAMRRIKTKVLSAYAELKEAA